MGLTITYPRTHEAWSGGDGIIGTGCTSATRDVPAKILVGDKDGHLVPCNYQYWFFGNEHGCGCGNNYVPSNDSPIDPEALEVIGQESYEGGVSQGEGFHEFARNLMHNPPAGVQFIRYDGVEEVLPPREYWGFLGIKIAKKQRACFSHRFSLCRLRTPLDKEYETRVTMRKHQAAERQAELMRLEQEFSPLTLDEYLKVSNQEIGTFDIVPLEYSEEKTIPSGGSLPPIDRLGSLAKKNFFKKAPFRTKRVIAKSEIVEIPSTFWVRGKQRVTYRGIALVPKKSEH